MASAPRPARTRRLRRHARTFYLTVFIFTLLACYSFFAGSARHTQLLATRSLEARELEVRFPCSPPTSNVPPP